jgi:XTP/dITP diphosphohydrolase
MKLIAATKNPSKIRELKELCKDTGIELTTLDEYEHIPDIVEDGESFRENALKKAQFIFNYTGEFSIADDSGLEVDFLNGRPGIYSSRYAGEEATDEENNAKLLRELGGRDIADRRAVFRCVIALVGPGVEETFEGECRGLISCAPQGENGFGYDPLFYLPSLNRTMAELSSAEKNRISHRAQALCKLKSWLEEHRTLLIKK